MKTLDEAIKHCEEKAKELKQKAETNKFMAQEKEMCENAGKVSKYIHSAKELEEIANGCLECASEHEQLMEWLTELKAYKACPLMQNACYFCRADRCHNGGQKNETD